MTCLYVVLSSMYAILSYIFDIHVFGLWPTGNLPFLSFIEETFQYYVNQLRDVPQYMVCFERFNTIFCGIVVYHNYADFATSKKFLLL